jgi:hypothetical protein
VTFKIEIRIKVTPRLRAESVGDKEAFLKKMEELVILDRCCLVPISRYSVLEGLTTRRLAQNQEWTWSRVVVSFARAKLESLLEKEM